VTGARSGSGAPPHEEAGPEGAARSHARHVLGRDPRARDDVETGAEVTPPDLVDWLLGQTFHTFELVAHARIGSHHVFKTKFVGPTTLVVQARWVADAGGRWRIREAEVARVEGAAPEAPRPASRPGEV
jgi:hypothetical protein